MISGAFVFLWFAGTYGLFRLWWIKKINTTLIEFIYEEPPEDMPDSQKVTWYTLNLFFGKSYDVHLKEDEVFRFTEVFSFTHWRIEHFFPGLIAMVLRARALIPEAHAEQIVPKG